MTWKILFQFLSYFLPLFYLLFIQMLIKGWRNTALKVRPQLLPEDIRVSVVVAVRNEAPQMAALFSSFHQQNYPAHLTEYILVNDHSTDHSAEEIRLQLKQLSSNVILLNLEEGITGKKAAISKAIEAASGNLIVTTDADCTAGPEWISCIVEYYRTYECKMILGGVTYISSGSLWDRLQQMEFQSLIGTGASMAGIGKPAMSNGANLTYERSVFNDLEGYKGTPDTASGDDLFLMYRLHEKSPGSVIYMHDPAAYVSTKPSPDFSSFIQQRKRWAGKWNYYALPWAKALPIVLFFYYLLLLFTWLGALLLHSWLIFVLTFAIKAVLDRIWLEPVTKEAGFRVSTPVWILLSFLYPLYAVFFGIFSKMGRYRWKGRELSS